jgi:hypothetical protein
LIWISALGDTCRRLFGFTRGLPDNLLRVMITFSVVKEQYGWAIRAGERMKTLFWSRDLAIREANCLADAIRCHGECVEVIVEGAGPNEVPKRIKGSSSARPDALARGHWVT